jgi:hypothetical protein
MEVFIMAGKRSFTGTLLLAIKEEAGLDGLLQFIFFCGPEDLPKIKDLLDIDDPQTRRKEMKVARELGQIKAEAEVRGQEGEIGYLHNVVGQDISNINDLTERLEEAKMSSEDLQNKLRISEGLNERYEARINKIENLLASEISASRTTKDVVLDLGQKVNDANDILRTVSSKTSQRGLMRAVRKLRTVLTATANR